MLLLLLAREAGPRAEAGVQGGILVAGSRVEGRVTQGDRATEAPRAILLLRPRREQPVRSGVCGREGEREAEVNKWP